ncbi:hypothetical protein C8F01DRAFT_83723 [Mycena amicta]|nr:hypothetical protein C8F01DRAFT_83723 [Mycena amicta]
MPKRSRMRVASSSPEAEVPDLKRRRTKYHDNRSTSSSVATSDAEIPQEEINDLRSSPAPASKPTNKERVRKLTEELQRRLGRDRKKTGAVSPLATASDKTEYSEEEAVAENQEEESESNTDSHNSFIAETDQDKSTSASQTPARDETDTSSQFSVEEPLGPDLKQYLAHFIVGIVKFSFNEELTHDHDDMHSYREAMDKLKARLDTFTGPLAAATWTVPFKHTLDKRPVLDGPIESSSYDVDELQCDVCYVGGKFACKGPMTRMWTLSTLKGLYNPETFKDIVETAQAYSEQTVSDLESRTEALKILYPPDFRLVIGERCAQQASR